MHAKHLVCVLFFFWVKILSKKFVKEICKRLCQFIVFEESHMVQEISQGLDLLGEDFAFVLELKDFFLLDK